MAVTQKQIAEKLGISVSLVARALLGHTEVAQSTRERVQQAALEMGYSSTSSREARAMAAKRHGKRVKNGVVAILYYLDPELSSQTTMFFDPVMQGMESEAALDGVEVCLCPCPPNALPRFVRERSVDGVIFLTLSQDFVPAIRELNLPVVLFQDRCEIAHSVNTDDRRGTYEATRHLLEMGHRRIAYLGVQNTLGRPNEIRLQGYLDAMHEFGISIPNEWICDNLWASNASNRTERADIVGWTTLLEQNGVEPASNELPFTGLVCYNDPVAMGAIAGIREGGWQVPEDISVIGFDNTPNPNFSPILTSIGYDRSELGRKAIRVLLDAIRKADDNLSDLKFEHAIVKTYLAIGESTAAPKEARELVQSQS